MLFFKQIETKMIGLLLKKGHRGSALKIWFRVMILLKENLKKRNVALLVSKAINNIKPTVVLKNRKRGGTVYQIPYLVQNVKRDMSMMLALRWLVQAASEHPGRNMAECLAKEIKDAFYKQGRCVKKRNEIYKLALQNRIYIKFLFSKKKKRRVNIR